MTNAQKKQELNNKLSLPIPENEKEAARIELERIKDLPDQWDYAAEGESASERILNENRGTTSAGVADASGTITDNAGHGNQDQNRLAIGNTESIGKINPKTGRPENYGEVVGSNVTTEGDKVDDLPSNNGGFQVGKKVAEEAGIDTTPSKDDTSKEKAAKNQYNKSAMSIWDAYYAGVFGDVGSPEAKRTAEYFTIDAIAKLASNLGRRIGNVGAQFSGGTIDNNKDVSAWEQRKDAILEQEIGKEAESIDAAAGRKARSEEASIESQELANARTRIQNEYTAPQLELALKSLENELTAQGLNINLMESRQDIIDTLKSDPDYHNSAIKQLVVGYLAQSGAAGAVNTGGNVLGNILSFALK